MRAAGLPVCAAWPRGTLSMCGGQRQYNTQSDPTPRAIESHFGTYVFFDAEPPAPTDRRPHSRMPMEASAQSIALAPKKVGNIVVGRRRSQDQFTQFKCQLDLSEIIHVVPFEKFKSGCGTMDTRVRRRRQAAASLGSSCRFLETVSVVKKKTDLLSKTARLLLACTQRARTPCEEDCAELAVPADREGTGLFY